LVGIADLRYYRPAMKAFTRLLLLLMVAVAVPVHGALAITVGQCRALEHTGGDSGGHEAAGHGAATADSHDHQQHTHPASGSESLADSDDPASSESHCGPCSACCASAAITGPVQPQLLNEVFALLDLSPDEQPISIRLAGLDRPPLAL
jgi:hypothetical protein